MPRLVAKAEVFNFSQALELRDRIVRSDALAESSLPLGGGGPEEGG